MSYTNRVAPVLGNPDWVGKLVFHYHDGTDVPKTKTIPFYENPTIRESQSARIGEFSPIGRAGQNFAYLGAESRNINISFNITLPHLYSIVPEQEPLDSPSIAKEAYKNSILWMMSEKLPGNWNASGHGSAKYDHLYEQMLPDAEKALNTFNKISTPLSQLDSGATKERRRIINLVSDYIQAIRSSTINHADKPIYGSPLVRLFFGQLYENVPCICFSYAIEAVISAGYDKRTVLPRVLKVSLNLKEARNFGKYEQSTQIHRDSLAGWEFIVGSSNKSGTSTDPWRMT